MDKTTPNNKEPSTPASEPVAPGLTEFDLGGIRNGSGSVASELIADAAWWVKAVIDNKNVPDTVTENPLLVATHAMAALLDFELGRIVPILERGCAALEQIAESLDFLAARPDVNEASDSPTAHERQIIFEALKAEYINSKSSLNPKEQESALCDALMRFEKLSGL